MNQVEGMLTIANIHVDPFVTICNNCSFPTNTFGTISEDELHCSTCKQSTTYRLSLQLQCIIQTKENVQYKCILKNSLLLDLCPSLLGLTCEKYLEDTTDVTYNLWEFHVQGSSILDNANVILHIE